MTKNILSDGLDISMQTFSGSIYLQPSVHFSQGALQYTQISVHQDKNLSFTSTISREYKATGSASLRILSQVSVTSPLRKGCVAKVASAEQPKPTPGEDVTPDAL